MRSYFPREARNEAVQDLAARAVCIVLYADEVMAEIQIRCIEEFIEAKIELLVSVHDVDHLRHVGTERDIHALCALYDGENQIHIGHVKSFLPVYDAHRQAVEWFFVVSRRSEPDLRSGSRRGIQLP